MDRLHPQEFCKAGPCQRETGAEASQENNNDRDVEIEISKEHVRIKTKANDLSVLTMILRFDSRFTHKVFMQTKNNTCAST